MLTLTYTASLALFLLFSAIGCIVAAIICALVFLGLLAREFYLDARRLHQIPIPRG